MTCVQEQGEILRQYSKTDGTEVNYMEKMRTFESKVGDLRVILPMKRDI